MKRYAIRKQTHRDFESRLKRLDPHFARHGHTTYGKDMTPSRPVFWTLAGFGWFYLVISISNNKAFIEQSLLQGSLQQQHQNIIIAGLGAMLAISGVMLLLHLFRIFAKPGAKRSNSKGVLMGALAALALVYTPPSVFHAGYGMIDSNSRSLLLAAHSTVTNSVPGVDWDKIALVSSLGK